MIKKDETARSIALGILFLDKNFNGDSEAVETYLENFHQKQLKTIDQATKAKPITRRLWFRMAAFLLLLVSVGAVVRLMLAGPDLKTLLSQELSQPYPLSNLVRGEGDGSAKEQAFQLYAQGDFAKASVYFEAAANEENENASVVFYNAMSYLYSGNYGKAKVLLETELVANSRYAQQGVWYRALALIQSGDKEEGIELLKAIKDNEQHFKHEAATEIFELLE